MIFPAAPQHVVLDEARRRLAVVHPAAQRRDELRRLDGAGAWAVAVPGRVEPWGTFPCGKKCGRSTMEHMEKYGKLWKNMENYGKYGQIIKNIWKTMENYGHKSRI